MYEHYFAWTSTNQLIRFPEKESVSEAGIFYHNESFTFPNEKNGKPDTIIWNLITEEATEKEDKDGNAIMKVTEKKSAVYTWDCANEKITGPVRK